MRHQLQIASRVAVLALLFLLWSETARAAEQQIVQLVQGWNTVFLEIDPVDPECHKQFGSLPVVSVWTYENRFSGNQGENDPVAQLGWRVYVASEGEQPVISNLFTLHAGRGYLIRAAAPATWTITGTTSAEPLNWAPHAYTLQGLFVDSGSPPTFQTYLSPSPAHSSADAKAFRVPVDGALVQVNKASETISRGRAQWVFSTSFSDYSGPVDLPGLPAAGLEFPIGIVEQVLSIRNLRADARTITVELGSGASVPMEYFDTTDPGEPAGIWRPLGSVGLQFVENEASHKQLRLRVRRFGQPADNYEQSLVVTDGAGYRRLLPVTIGIEGPQGLWVGRATLNSAGRGVGNMGEAPETIIPLILHVSDEDAQQQRQVTLLRQASVMWKEGVIQDNPGAPDYGEVIVPGRSVLVTSTGNPANYSPGALRDGRLFSFRTTSTVLHEDVPLTGAFNGVLEGIVLMPATHPLNPFMHRYHPDHGHPDVVPDALGGYEFSRRITLEFTSTDPQGSDYSEPPGWGDYVVGGHYREVIRGVISPNDDQPESQTRHVEVGGNFYLWRVSRVGVLNDGE